MIVSKPSIIFKAMLGQIKVSKYHPKREESKTSSPTTSLDTHSQNDTEFYHNLIQSNVLSVRSLRREKMWSALTVKKKKKLIAEHKNPLSPLTLAGLAWLAVCHVVKDVLHCTTVGKVALPHFPIGLLSPLALVSVQKENKLLLDELALLWISCVGSRTHPLGHRSHQAWLLDLRGLLLALRDKTIKIHLTLGVIVCYLLNKYGLGDFRWKPLRTVYHLPDPIFWHRGFYDKWWLLPTRSSI